MGLLTRRQFIGAAAGLSMAGGGLALPASGLTINPRSTWGASHPPKGPLDAEDVKFLIVHHSASHNGYTSADVPGILRGWFNFHTGPGRGWNDIAYNFIIDSEGVMWEGRQGSLAGPVAGDATGGNQGFTQLVCVIGDFNTGQPTAAALDSLPVLLAWLADRSGVSTSPGSQVTFTSRGSNKWPTGTSVTAPTITGHRDMSNTTCPGDNFYPYVAGQLMADVQAVRSGGSPAPTTTASTSSTITTSTTSTTSTSPTSTTVPPTTTTTAPTTTTVTPTATTTLPVSTTVSTTVTVPPTTTPATPTSTLPVAVGPVESRGASPLLVGSGVIVAVGTGLLLWRYRRMGGYLGNLSGCGPDTGRSS